MNTKFIFALLLFLGISILGFAAPAPPSNSGNAGTNGNGGGQPFCWPPPCIPIDGGISLLIAAGAVYGGRKLYNNQKEKNSL